MTTEKCQMLNERWLFTPSKNAFDLGWPSGIFPERLGLCYRRATPPQLMRSTRQRLSVASEEEEFSSCDALDLMESWLELHLAWRLSCWQAACPSLRPNAVESTSRFTAFRL